MKIKDLKKLLKNYPDDFEVVIEDDNLKITGVYWLKDLKEEYECEEYINSDGGRWEKGLGYAPNGECCGECIEFDCGKCGAEVSDDGQGT